MTDKPYAVLTDQGGDYRHFRTFESAERWARKVVFDSRKDRFAERATIYLNAMPWAEVRMDGAERVWTDLKEYADVCRTI